MDYDIRKDLFEAFLIALTKRHGVDYPPAQLARQARLLVDETVEQFGKYEQDGNPLK